jgi:hypothetical protein
MSRAIDRKWLSPLGEGPPGTIGPSRLQNLELQFANLQNDRSLKTLLHALASKPNQFLNAAFV